MMHWHELISFKRLGVSGIQVAPSYRTTFQKDFDRLIFSAAFRRLQDKTQVFPLARTDYVRTRLTHSLEVSSVCRSLGSMLGEYLVKTDQLTGISPSDIGAILAAAALAHDIGNPPFGHAGEETISLFFKDNTVGCKVIETLTIEQQADFLHFEGNAQAFRLLTKLQNRDNEGGLQLSLPVIASFIKYPRPSFVSNNLGHHIAFKKFNYFQAEKKIFRDLADSVGLLAHETEKGVWYRHPLSYLLEAADDICYGLVDIEDAYRLGLIDAKKAFDFYESVICANSSMPFKKLGKIRREKDQIEYLRAFTIGLLIDEVITCSIENEQDILAGKCMQDLLSIIPSQKALKSIQAYSYKNIYVSPPVLEVGIAGFKVLETLLEAFVGAVEQEYNGGGTSKTRMLVEFLPDQFLGKSRKIDEDPYIRILKVTDFLSGMTDRYAVKVFKMITGMNLSA